jgi:bisphosphoglycerate-dependent phosphoglycerate mutase
MADEITVSVEEQDTLVTTSELSNPAVVESLTDVGDVDVTTNGLNNGSLLVYKLATNKWTATRLLDYQVMEGGEF